MAIKYGTSDIKKMYIYTEETPITTAGIYHNPDLGLISLSTDGTNWLTIADKNLGATTVWNDGDTLSQANCGNYYQRGNNYGFPRTGNITTSSTPVNAGTYGPLNYYNSNTFIYGNYWDNSYNGNLRGNTTDTNEARKGPCPVGFHIPTITELTALNNAGISMGAWASNGGDNFTKYLKRPRSGYRTYNSSTGATAAQGTRANTWASNPSGNNNAYLLISGSSEISPNTTRNKTYGFCIRPFKNDAIQPRVGNERTALYSS